MPANYHDVHNNVSIKRSISPAVIGTTGIGRTGKPVDAGNFGGVEVIFSFGSVTATGAIFSPVVLEGDVSSAMTPVAATDLLGSVINAGIAATPTRTSGVSMNVTKRVGYIGQRRWVSAAISSTITAATLISADVLLTRPRSAPVAT
jgi:hypothetical protein